MAGTEPAVATICWRVPELAERPAVGTSCCASTAEAIVAQELSMLPGVDDVLIDCAAGTVEVRYVAALVTPDEIASSLAEIGYPPA